MRFRRNRPDQRNDPPNPGPPQKQVQQKDACRVQLIPSDKRRQKVQQKHKKQG
jgi:hypothetical protein